MNYLLHSRQGIYRYYDDKKDRVMEITAADFNKKKNMDISGVLRYEDKSYARQRQIPQSFFRLFANTYHIPELKKNGYSAEKTYLNFACRNVNKGDRLSDIYKLYKKAPELIGERKRKQTEKQQQYMQKNLVYRKDGTVIDYITGINKPDIEREIDNANTKTFDFITVYYSLKSSLTMSQEDLMAAVNRDIRDIVQHAFHLIDDACTFQKFGIPVNILKCSRCMVTADRMLQLTFEPKIRNLDMENKKDMEEEEIER